MEQAHEVRWVDAGRWPQCPPNPNYPTGIDVIETIGPDTCKVDLPYPAKRCGAYEVQCQACGRKMTVTTAGRPDDPRSLTMQCASGKRTNPSS